MTSDVHRPASYATHIHSLISLGIPIIIGQIGSIIQGLADTLMVGRYSSDSLSSAGFVNNVMLLVIVFAMGYAYGLTPEVGSLHARNRYTEAGRALRCSLQINSAMTAVLCSLLLTLYFFIDKLGQPEELLPLIRPYYLVVLISLPFQFLFNSFKQFSDGIGDTRSPMWVLLSANVLNIIGNALLIYGIGPFPEMGLVGAGISTLFSRIFMLCCMAALFFHATRFAPYRAGFFTNTTANTDQRKHLHKLGMPIALQMGMETASFNLCAVMMGWLGAAQLAAHQIMTNVGSLCFLIYYGIGAAVAIRISHFHGVNDWANARRASLSGLRMIMLTGAVLASSIVAFSDTICALFTNDPVIIQTATGLLVPFMLYQFGDGLQCNFANSLRGIADVKPMMRYAFISYIVVSLPLSYMLGFPFGWGATGIWMAFPVALTLAGILFMQRFLSQTRRHLSPLKV